MQNQRQEQTSCSRNNADPREAQIQLLYERLESMKMEIEALLRDKDCLAARLDFQLKRNQQIPISQVVDDVNANNNSVCPPVEFCIPQNERDEELFKEINELKKIKEDLAVKNFSGGSCEARKLLIEAEVVSSEAGEKLKKLEKEVKDQGYTFESAILVLNTGGEKLDELLANVDVQKKILEDHLIVMKEQWMEEMKERLNLEAEYKLLKDKLEKLDNEEKKMVEENAELMIQLNSLRQLFIPNQQC